jgi:hypothetical protein
MDEYISKQSVIDYLNGYLHSIGEDGTYSPLFDRGQRRALINSIQDISAIKVADVQPVKHGQWIRSNDQCWLTCPFCDADVDVSCGTPFFYVDNDEVDHINFCPNCGAKMDGDIE